MPYNGYILFLKEIFEKGGIDMTSSDLIWRLVELLLHKDEKDLSQVALDQAQNDEKPNDRKQDEA